jgi:hypothetical protein
MARLDDIVNRINHIEERFEKLQCEQARLELQQDSMKTIIISQQEIIERHEAEIRKPNLLFNGVPESELVIDGICLRDEIDKVKYLCGELSDEFDGQCIESCFRLGRVDKHRNRPIKVRFKSHEMRNEILYSQKKMRDDQDLVRSFGRIYVNKDSSPLVRKEEKRLRERLLSERSKAPPNTNLRLRSGKLYKDSVVIDQINFQNQLF